MKQIKKLVTLATLMGLIYLDMEIFMRAMRGDLFKAGFHDVKWISLAGWTSLWMFFIGGFSGLFISFLNEGVLRKKKPPLWAQCLAGMTGIFTIEFVTGLICNIWLKFNIWSYEGWPLNIMGQITLMYAPLWFLLTPFILWMDEVIRYHLFDGEKPAPLFSWYKRLFTGK
jgi:hypothetical protein